MTLYCGYAPTNRVDKEFIKSTDIIKIINVKQIAKPYTNTNNNLYALIGDKLEVLCLGNVKQENTNIPLYISGQKIFSTNKKLLAQFYKKQTKLHSNKVKETIKHLRYAQSILNTKIPTYEDSYHWYLTKINTYNNKLEQMQQNYKTLLQNIKTI